MYDLQINLINTVLLHAGQKFSVEQIGTLMVPLLLSDCFDVLPQGDASSRAELRIGRKHQLFLNRLGKRAVLALCASPAKLLLVSSAWGIYGGAPQPHTAVSVSMF